jgi:hypothetical protein
MYILIYVHIYRNRYRMADRDRRDENDKHKVLGYKYTRDIQIHRRYTNTHKIYQYTQDIQRHTRYTKTHTIYKDTQDIQRHTRYIKTHKIYKDTQDI